MSAPTFAAYDRHLAEFAAGRKVWLRTAEGAADPIERELALQIAQRIEDYSSSVRSFLAHAQAQRRAVRPVDCRVR